jgi:hypothetical protein
MTTRVSSPKTVSINNESYRLNAPVVRQPTSQYAPKIVIGDTTKDSYSRTSAVTWSDFRSGHGVYRILDEGDFDRVWSSGAQLWYENHLVKSRLASITANPSLGVGTVDTISDFQNAIYATWDNGVDVRAYNNGTDSWGSSLRTLAAAATDSLSSFRMPNNSEYIAWAFTSGYTHYNGSTFANSAKATKYLAFWDDRLWGIDNTGQLWFSQLIGTETDDAKLPLPDGYVSRLFVGPDAGGERILYAATVDGLWAHDAANARFVETDVKYPRHQYGGHGATTWNGLIYVSAGMAVYEYNPRAGTVRSMGLDRDAGTPSRFRGRFDKLIPTQVALVGRTVGQVNELWGWNGRGWQRLTGGSFNPQGNDIHISSAYDAYRLYWTTFGPRVRYMSFPSEVSNPSEDTVSYSATTDVHRLPFFDGFQNETDKLAIRLHVEVSGASSDESVAVAYYLNFSVGSTNLGTITSDGVTTYTFQTGGVDSGLDFRNISFQFILSRGDTATNSPDIRRITFEYRKKQPAKWGFTVEVDHKEHMEGRSPETQLDDLRTAIESNTLVELVYRDRDDNAENYFVDIVNAEFVEQTGNEFEGITRLTCTEI